MVPFHAFQKEKRTGKYTLLVLVIKKLYYSSGIDGKFLTVLRVVRLARIVRIAKLSRHSRNLNTLIKTFRQSLRELSFLMLFFIG